MRGPAGGGELTMGLILILISTLYICFVVCGYLFIYLIFIASFSTMYFI